MKKIYAIAAAALIAIPATVNAQYYNIANQVANVLQAPLNGSPRYKGFVEASYIKGLGNTEADFLEITTSQGMQYNSWLYMGVGLGASVVFSHQNKDVEPNYWSQPGYIDRDSRTTGVMIPLFTDFRFTPWGSDTGLYIDIKAGCSFLVGKDYLRINKGFLTNQEYFYLRPSIGMKVPVNPEKPKQAIDFGVSYQLLTSNYWSGYYTDKAVNGLGLSIGYEW